MPNTRSKPFGTRLALLLLLILFSFSNLSFGQHKTEPLPSQPASIVLIIDDMGNNMELGQRAIALPGAINYAFLPNRHYSVTLANMAYQQHKEILLHAPMSNLQDHATGSGTLTAAMGRKQFLHTLQSNLKAIPHARGVNNHMGSLLTQLRQPMGWLMQTLKKNQLYFIDSRTTPLTIARSTAKQHQLPSLERDIFLDNNLDPTAIAHQFDRLLFLAKRQGLAVAIAHPHPQTLSFLEQALPRLAQQGFELKLASELLLHQHASNNATSNINSI